MRVKVTGLKAVLLGASVMASSAAMAPAAHAKSHGSAQGHTSRSSEPAHARGIHPAEFRPGFKRVHIGGHGLKSAWIGGGRFMTFAQATNPAATPDAAVETTTYSGGMSCVPFARANSGIELAGNAWAWWSNAAGVYERGSRPEVGSVLNFRANGRMHSGHVAVVTNVDSPRTVEVDHANWSGRGAISRNVSVVDVSPANDWSAVRVALGRGSEFGSVYPTYGFIYDRPDHGTLIANTAAVPMPMLANAAPRDLRPAAEQIDAATTDEPVEVADAEVRPSFRRALRHERHGEGRRELIHHVKAGASPAIEHHGRSRHLRG